jgi:hypothetical protein
MEFPATSAYQQYYTSIVFGCQSFRLLLIPDSKSILVIYLVEYIRNTITHSTNILVCSTDT